MQRYSLAHKITHTTARLHAATAALKGNNAAIAYIQSLAVGYRIAWKHLGFVNMLRVMAGV